MKSLHLLPSVLLTAAVLASSSAHAQTLYWNKPNAGLTWANSNNPNWTTTETGTTYQSWTGNADAVIVTPSASISIGGTAPTASSLTVTSGATFTGVGNSSTGLNITGASGTSGSGNFSLVDNATNEASIRIMLTDSTAGHMGYAGTITVGAFTNAGSGLQLGADSKVTSPSNPLTGSGVNTHVVLNGGRLFLSGGVANTTAVIGSLSGTGAVQLNSIFNSNSGTRTLKVDQSTNTTFSGVIGASSISQTNNVLALTKSGTGTLAIQAAADSGYSGDTLVSAGKLSLSGTFGSTTGNVTQGNFRVQNGATLGLDGTFNTGGTKTITIENGGILDVGTLNFNGVGTTTSVGLVVDGTATLAFSLGTTQDMVTFADATMIGSAAGGAGSIRFDFTNTGGVTAGTTYDLISFGGTTQGISLSSFALSQNSIDAGWAGTFGYGGDGNLLQFSVSSVIPEPGTYAFLAGVAGLGLALARRRRTPGASLPLTALVVGCAIAGSAFAPRASAASNLIANGGFESGAEGWDLFVPSDSKGKGCSFDLQTVSVHEGISAAQLKAESPARFSIATPKAINVRPGTYLLSAWIRADEDFQVARKQAGFVIRVNYLKPGQREPLDTDFINWMGETAQAGPEMSAPVPTNWTQVKSTVTVPEGCDRLKLDFFVWQAKGSILIDDISLTPGS